MRKILLPILAVIGALVALFVAFWSERTLPPTPIPFPPPTSPYPSAIYGEGIVEPSSRNLSIGSPFNEIVTKVFVLEGDMVHAGTPLFQLDTRTLEAEAEAARGQLAVALANLENQRVQFAFYQRLTNKNAVSMQQYEQAYFSLKEAEAQLLVAQGNLATVESNIEKSLVRAPISGEILQVNIHIGEVAPIIPISNVQALIPYGSSQFPLILMGSAAPFNLRIDIDEADCWRYQRGRPACAFVRGNSHLSFPLEFVHLEPYIIPKASFTGETTQRIDTRVLQVLYQFESTNLPIYAGQVLDVFIEAPSLTEEP